MSLRIFKTIGLTLAMVCAASSQSSALQVEGLRFGLHEDKTRLVLELDEQTDFRIFTLDNPYRMVIDLPSFTWKASKSDQPKTTGILAMRHGELKPGISRIVFDINRPISLQNAFILPSKDKNPHRLVVDFSNISPSLFQTTKNKVLGTLNDKQQPPASQNRTTDIATPGAPPKPQAKPSQNKGYAKNTHKPVIIIDPGHGGVDPGALGANLKEKNIVLGLAKALKQDLESTGRYNVKMTREDDRFIKLYNRVKFARQHEGDLFVSIHADSIGDKKVSGTSIYTLSDKASDAQTAKLAAKENKADLIAGIDLSTEDKDVANILVDLAMRDTMNQSRFFAGKLVSNMPSNGINLLEKPHRYAGFAVLKAPDIPSILIEAGFISNPSEARRLNSPEFRKKFAGALRKSIDLYFEQVEKNQRQ